MFKRFLSYGDGRYRMNFIVFGLRIWIPWWPRRSAAVPMMEQYDRRADCSAVWIALTYLRKNQLPHKSAVDRLESLLRRLDAEYEKHGGYAYWSKPNPTLTTGAHGCSE